MIRDLGFGLGLRPDHYDAILADRPAIDFFEALTENYLVSGGKPLHYLDRIRAHYPIVLHGGSPCTRHRCATCNPGPSFLVLPIAARNSGPLRSWAMPALSIYASR